MFSNCLVMSMIYSSIIGLLISLAALFIWHSIKITVMSSDMYASHQSRLRAACHQVNAYRGSMFQQNIKRAGGSVTRMSEQVYNFVYNGKNYRYTYRGTDDRGDMLQLYFLKNPTFACTEEELLPKEHHWSKNVLLLAVIVAAILFRYIYHYMEVISVR